MNESLSVPELRAELRGTVIAPGEAGYDAARRVFFGGFDRRPAVVVRARDATDVARVVALAGQTGLELAVRSGGHSLAGHGTSNGGIVLDLSAMDALQIDPDRRTAWAQPGLTAGAYSVAAAAHGLATGFGDTGSVGLGGITLGGGMGYLSRRHGLSIDDLLAAEIVTADGTRRRVDAANEPDLFWAIRGGGGNFGVATRLQFRLHELDTVLGGMLVLPATAQTVAAFAAESQAAPEALTTIANVMPAPPMPMVPAEHHGRPVILALLCYAGDPATGQRVVAPFRSLATPLVDQVRPSSYPALLAAEEGEEGGRHPAVTSRVMFRDTFDHAAADTIVRGLADPEAGMGAVQLRVLGGAVSRVPAGATAYAHRAREIMLNLAAFYDDPADRAARQSWVDGLASALPEGEAGTYVNFVGDEGPDQVRQAYPGATWDRLREVKRRYDPANLFRVNHNVPPA